MARRRLSDLRSSLALLRVIVSKRLGSPYKSGRSAHWVKIKNLKARSRGGLDVKGPTTIQVRCPAELLIKLDMWRRAQPDAPSRAIAVRRLAEQALAGTGSRQRSSGSRHKAAEMAGSELDHLGDQTVSDKERKRRKRRLISGPREFRNIRDDQ